MKITTKPIRSITRPETPAVRAVVASPKVPRAQLVERSYQQLVTVQNVHPERAKELLGLSQK